MKQVVDYSARKAIAASNSDTCVGEFRLLRLRSVQVRSTLDL
ncbi:hypothetical protein [Nostoc linckia]|nr:hypothetical protein [Nostoc linckia]